MLCKCQRG